MKSFEEIILGPIVTEKNSILKTEQNCHVFKVAPAAGKIEIKKAVEKLFNVKVKGVNTSCAHGKVRGRIRGVLGHTTGYKKAFVTLESGQKISLIENML